MSGPDPRPQSEKFRDLTRELEAYEDEERFEETVRQITPKQPPADEPSSE